MSWAQAEGAGHRASCLLVVVHSRLIARAPALAQDALAGRAKSDRPRGART